MLIATQRNEENYKELNEWYNNIMRRMNAAFYETNTYFYWDTEKLVAPVYGRQLRGSAIVVPFEQFMNQVKNNAYELY